MRNGEKFFFSPLGTIIDYYCARFFHFPRLARAQVIRESAAGRRSAAFPCPVSRVRGGGTSPLPSSPLPILLLVSPVRIHRIVNDPGETLAVTKRLSPPLPRFYIRVLFTRIFSPTRVLELGREFRGGRGGGWMNVPMISYQKGGEGSTVIWSEFFFLFF